MIDIDHRIDQSGDLGRFRKIARDFAKLFFGRFAEITDHIVQAGVLRGRSCCHEPSFRLCCRPTAVRLANYGGGCRTAMPAMMAMDIDRTCQRLASFGQLKLKIRANAIVTVRQMDVAHSVLARGLHVRLRPIYTKDGFDPELFERRKRSLAFRRAAGEYVGADGEHIMEPRSFERFYAGWDRIWAIVKTFRREDYNAASDGEKRHSEQRFHSWLIGFHQCFIKFQPIAAVPVNIDRWWNAIKNEYLTTKRAFRSEVCRSILICV